MEGILLKEQNLTSENKDRFEIKVSVIRSRSQWIESREKPTF